MPVSVLVSFWSEFGCIWICILTTQRIWVWSDTCQTGFDINIKCIKDYSYSLHQVIEKFSDDDDDLKTTVDDATNIFNESRK